MNCVLEKRNIGFLKQLYLYRQNWNFFDWNYSWRMLEWNHFFLMQKFHFWCPHNLSEFPIIPFLIHLTVLDKLSEKNLFWKRVSMGLEELCWSAETRKMNNTNILISILFKNSSVHNPFRLKVPIIATLQETVYFQDHWSRYYPFLCALFSPFLNHKISVSSSLLIIFIFIIMP